MISLKDLSPAQQRMLNDMVGSTLKKTPQGWFAKSYRAHADVTRQKLMELGLIEHTGWRAFEMQLTSEGYDLAVGKGGAA